MRWSETVTLEFVKIYMNHECLWNPEHPDYKARHKREKAYGLIGAEFKRISNKNLTLPDVKVKIKNLRTTYNQQVNKILQKSSPDSIYEPSLVWFHEMDKFLKNVPSHRQLVTYDSIQQAPEVDSSEIWIDQNTEQNEINPDPLTSQTEDEYDHQVVDTSIKRERHSPYKKIKKKKLKHNSFLNSLRKESQFGDEDEFDIYGKFIASQLRQMDLQKALRLQLEIQSLVSEARISDIVDG